MTGLIRSVPFQLPPIIERELRVASRRGTTYWSRVGAALSGICIFFWVMMAQLAVGPAAAAGRITFRLLAGVAAFTVVGAVLQLSSEAFAREKREDTLGLLFLTPLQPIDLVLGKLVSTSLSAFYRFVAIVPLLALPILVGGVTLTNFLLLVLALLNLVFFAATVGLYVSARAWDEKRAATIATITMLGVTVLLPVMVAAPAAVLGLPGAVYALALSPAFAIWQATVPGAAGSMALWVPLLLTHLAGWILFRATCRVLPLCWRNRPALLPSLRENLRHREDAVALSFQPASQPPRLSNPAGALKMRRAVRRQFDAHHRAQLLDQNPILWLALRWRSESTRAWIIGSVGLVGFVVSVMTGRWQTLFSPTLALFVCFCANAALKTYVAAQASGVFARDRGECSLELLLSTPLTPDQLVRGHMLALRAPLQRSIPLALWIQASWMVISLSVYAVTGGHGTLLWALASLVLLGFLIPDLYAVGWTALWQGVIARNARAAEHDAVMQVLVLPWAAGALAAFIAAALTGPDGGMAVFIICWIVFSAAMDWWSVRRSRRKLYAELGLWALRRSAGEVEQYDGWRRVGRRAGQWWARLTRPL